MALRVQSGGKGLAPSVIVGSVRWCEAKFQDSVRVQGKLEVQNWVRVQSRVRQNDKAEHTKSEFWGYNLLLFRVDTRDLNINDK